MDATGTTIASIDEVAASWFQHHAGGHGGPQRPPGGNGGVQRPSGGNSGVPRSSGGNSGDVSFLFLAVIFVLAVVFVIRRFFKPPKPPKPDEGPAPPISDMGHDPPGWVPGRTGNRSRQEISEVAPATVIGQVREIRSWEEKGIFFKWKMKAFHLDSDHSQPDFGDLMVTLRVDYFRRLKLEDSDRLEIGLKWKRRRKLASISYIRDITSGQLFKPSSVSEKAGKLEEVVVAR